MKKIADRALIIRSKNAGPLYITLDLIFENREEMEFVESHLKRESIAHAYHISPERMVIIPFAEVNAIKITFPRQCISGSPEDCDVYGCQQHMPLADLKI